MTNSNPQPTKPEPVYIIVDTPTEKLFRAFLWTGIGLATLFLLLMCLSYGGGESKNTASVYAVEPSGRPQTAWDPDVFSQHHPEGTRFIFNDHEYTVHKQ